MANLRVSELIQRSPVDGTEYLEVIIPPFTPGTNRKVLLSDLTAALSVPDATSSTKGIAKLYPNLSAENTDGAPDQNSVVDALALKQALVNTAVALTDAGTIDLTAIKHTLTTALGRTFTISYPGDDISLRITLNATSATQTFPVGAKCITDGASTGNNTCPMSGTSGDTYAITIKHWGSGQYTVISKNEDQ